MRNSWIALILCSTLIPHQILALNISDLNVISISPDEQFLNTTLDCSLENSCPNLNDTKTTCNCDQQCSTFGDCCKDVAEFIPPNPQFECQKIKTNLSGNMWYYIITSCSKTWKDYGIREMCENQTDSKPFFNYPVSNIQNNVTYKNIYCALCNYDRDSSFWNLTFRCNKRSDLQNVTTAVDACIAAFDPPSPILNLRECNDLPTLLGCPNEISEASMEADKNNCESFIEPVRVIGRTGKAYRNIYCAYCNGLKDDELECGGKRKLRNPTRLIPHVFTLSLLLDGGFYHEDNIIGEVLKCPEGDVYDPFDNICRHAHAFVPAVNSTAQNNNCSGFLETNFQKSENGFPKLYNGRELKNEEFHYLNETSIIVCASRSASKFDIIQEYLTKICLSISLISLLFKFVLQYRRNDNSFPNKIILCLCIAIFISQLLFVFALNKSENTLCYASSIMIHYFFLSSHFWMNALSYNIWKTFKTVEITVKSGRFWKYNCYGWGTPLIIIIISTIFDIFLPSSDWQPNYGVTICWITNRKALVLFFGAPLLILILCNLYYYFYTVFEIFTTARSGKGIRKTTKDKNRVCLYIKLAGIMGLTWIFGFLASSFEIVAFWYLFIIFNGLQGMFIFLAFSRFREILQIGGVKNRRPRNWSSLSKTKSLSLSSNSNPSA